MSKTVVITFLGTEISVPRKETKDKQLKSLITLLSRSECDMRSLLVSTICRTCPRCNSVQRLVWFRDSLDLIEVDNTYELDISNASHKRDKEYGKYYACSEPNCPLKRLNPNSVEYISNAYNISKDTALKIIHSRNKSPFYSINHESKESYSAFQGHSTRSEESWKAYSESWKSSYYGNKADYISTKGQESWDEYMWAIKNRYDPNILKTQYSNWEEVLKSRKESNVAFRIDLLDHKWITAKYSKYDSEEKFKNHCLDLMNSENIGIIGFTMKIHSAEEKFKDISYLGPKGTNRLLAFKIKYSIGNLFEYFEIPKSVKKVYKNFLNSDSWSYSILEDGLFFRSDKEFTTYTKLKEIDSVKILSTNKRYPNSRKFYDIEIEYLGLRYYIEICAFNDRSDNAEYVDNVESKALKYSSILVYNIPKFIECLKSGESINDTKFY